MRIVLSLAVLAFIVSCGPNATNDPVMNCIEQQKIYCQLAYRCCVEPDEREKFAGNILGAHQNENECVEWATSLCEAFTNYQRVSVERGRMAMDADKVNGCLEAKREATDECDLEKYYEQEDDCLEQIEGLVEDGDTCWHSGECVEGGSCVIDYDDEGDPDDVDEEYAVAEGECKEPPDVGDPCPDFNCKEGLYCDDEDVCRRPPGEGEECTDFYCAEGYSCQDPDLDFVYTCERLLANGQDCEYDFECQSYNCEDDSGECEEYDDGTVDVDYDYCEG